MKTNELVKWLEEHGPFNDDSEVWIDATDSGFSQTMDGEGAVYLDREGDVIIEGVPF